MEVFDVRKDRADVMAVAAVVLSSLAQRWKLNQALVPGVGRKEGVLCDVLASLAGETRGQKRNLARGRAAPAARESAAAIIGREEDLLAGTRRFAARLGYDRAHCEHIAALAASLFDQLGALHKMDAGMRLILRMGALLHDIGHVVGRQAHHKVGEYLVRHADLPGISDFERNMVACLVRYHSESEPDAEHKIFSTLDDAGQKQVHLLVAMLRIADRLDSDHQQLVSAVKVRATPARVTLRLTMRRRSDLTLWSVARGGALLQEELGRKLVVAGKGAAPVEAHPLPRRRAPRLKKKK
jgi:exopolyphosphatase/guanosine-5'-triphosphate,3'-diphosphate pyrophosphatase